MIDPMLVFEAGRMTVTAVKTAGSAVIAGGAVAHNWLKEKMPLGDRSQEPQGTSDFPPLNVPVSENTGYKIKLLENTAKALGTPESASLVKSIINQLNDESFKVLIVGRCNTGKSFLLNKLLERPLLKTGNGEITKTLAWLMYGEKNEEAAWYHDFQDDLHNITLDEIVQIPDEPPVFNMFACIHAEILRHGAILIDTPGLEKSPETADLTNEAIENADAVILVIDHYLEQSDQNFVKKLKKEGKAEKLFVVANKLDKAPAEEIPEIIKKRIDMFSELGVRTNIFPLSCKDDTIVPGEFEKFRSALVDYFDNGLQGAREGSVEHQIKNTASHFIKLCAEAAELTKISASTMQGERQKNTLKRLDEIEKETARVIKNNQREIHRLEQDVLGRWSELENTFKDEVNLAIQNATDEQLDRPGQLLTNVQKEINSFLLKEFQSAADQVLNSITHELDSIDTSTLPGRAHTLGKK